MCKDDEEHKGGRGTYLKNGFVYSCLAGQLQTVLAEDGAVSLIFFQRGFCCSSLYIFEQTITCNVHSKKDFETKCEWFYSAYLVTVKETSSIDQDQNINMSLLANLSICPILKHRSYFCASNWCCNLQTGLYVYTILGSRQ